LLVALLLGLVMPAATLRFATVERWCCCPDQSKCHCPDHEPGGDAQSSLGACHETQQIITSTPIAAFAPPSVVADAVAVAPVARAIVYATAEPHAAPPPRRPDAPS
jgi:hypothetical protein